MQPQTTPLVDYDTARRITVTRVLLERAEDDLEEIERGTDGALGEKVEETSMLVALALEELPCTRSARTVRSDTNTRPLLLHPATVAFGRGAQRRGGLDRVATGSRVADAVARAGGLAKRPIPRASTWPLPWRTVSSSSCPRDCLWRLRLPRVRPWTASATLLRRGRCS